MCLAVGPIELKRLQQRCLGGFELSSLKQHITELEPPLC